ncbi:MAG TPA: OmpH family outer membrane protein [Candidatus Tidjanibacter faecipullorum]|uniref:OmpH family outer membrane protein n=1 Tax=Candidatus Tidjanibacter faecipullorum TaxID=2838766 RepID=A0A9D2DEG4_9BACT|nr:OmpH family outer membrane protein [Candidatus Tidjanibacter faecipullorum]
MKKLFVAAAVLLAFTACQNKQQGTAAENTETAGTELAEKAAPAVAYVQIDSLMLDYKLAEELRNTFQAKANKADREFNAKYQKFEKDMMDAQDKIQKGLVTRATAEQMQQQLMQQQQELMETRDRMMGELAEEEQVMNNRIYFAVTDYLKEYNADYKYAMILSTAAGTGPVLHADPSLDITKEVLAGLNARYEAEKSGK